VNDAQSRGAGVVSFDVYDKSERPGRSHVRVPDGDFLRLSLILEKIALERSPAPETVASSAGLGELRSYFKEASWVSSPPGLEEETIKGLCENLAATPNSVVIVGERWLTAGPAFEQTAQLIQALALFGAAERVLFPVGEANSWGLCNFISDFKGPAIRPEDLLGGAVSDLSTIFLCGDDLLNIAPRPDLLEQALSSAGTVVVIDRFQNEAMSFADVVLPSCGFAETDGTVISAFGVLGRWRQTVSPPGQAASERIWFSRLARAMDMQPGPDTPLDCWQRVPSFLSSQQLNQIQDLYRTDGSWLRWTEEETEFRFAPPEAFSAEPRPQEWPTRLFFSRHPANWKSGAVTGRDEILKRENVDRLVLLSPADLKNAGMKPGARAVVETPNGADSYVTGEDPRLPDGVALIQEPPGFRRSVPGRVPGLQRGLSFQPVPGRIKKA